VPGSIVALGPRAQVLASGHESGRLLLFDANTGKQKPFGTPDWVRAR
jgi:hypothetical protein